MNNRLPKKNQDSMFFTESDFELEIEIGREYMQSDIGKVFYLYKINREVSNIKKVYGTTPADKKTFKGPYELRGNVKIGTPNSKRIINSDIYSELYGETIFTVYINELKEKNLEIILGDYIGFYVKPDKMEFFEVTSPNLIDDSNKQSIARYGSFYKTIGTTYVQMDSFTGDLPNYPYRLQN